MGPQLAARHGETEAHLQLKRLSLLWAQAAGYSACALEVSVPRCRYRADVAGYRPAASGVGLTAIFECKQSLADLRRDNCCSARTLERLAVLHRRRAVLERCLRAHYPTLRCGESLFPEYDAYDLDAIEHKSYGRVTRELAALQNSLYGGTKFECLFRYRCADLFYLVLADGLFREGEVPAGWGVLVENSGDLVLVRKPVLQDAADDARLRLLQRIAIAGTRQLNRAHAITFEDIGNRRKRGD